MCQSAGKTLELKMTWLACAIESEGSLQIAWGRVTKTGIQLIPRVNLVNKDSDYIENAIAISKELGFPGFVQKHDSIGCKHILWSGYKRVKRLIEGILPLLCTKRKKKIAETILDFINYRLSKPFHNVPYGNYEKQLFLKVRELNDKGRIPIEKLKLSFENTKESSTTIRPTLKSEDIVCSA